jgi:hypothetical protein
MQPENLKSIKSCQFFTFFRISLFCSVFLFCFRNHEKVEFLGDAKIFDSDFTQTKMQSPNSNPLNAKTAIFIMFVKQTKFKFLFYVMLKFVPLLRWLEKFLVGRTQFVRYGGAESSPAEVPSGVMQGSVLGPLLFNIYVADFPSAIKNSTLVQYADDCTLYKEVVVEDADC